MSSVGTVREGLRDNPLRLLLVARTVLVVLAGSLVLLDIIWGLSFHDIFSVRLVREVPQRVAFTACALIGIVAEFTSYRTARLVNLALYTGYVVWFTFFGSFELPAVVTWYVLSAGFAVSLWWLYFLTSPRRLTSTDAA